MKRLAILRHAKSSWDDGRLGDHDRPLNERGWKAARRIGREMEHRGLRFDYVLASPAVRVRETIDGVREKFPIEVEIRFEPRMYLATETALLELVRALPESAHAPLLVGHNPGLQGLIVELTHDDSEGKRARVAHKFPMGALALIELPLAPWPDAAVGIGEIAELTLPRDLA
jgi:phosphohistidine phosphatase